MPVQQPTIQATDSNRRKAMEDDRDSRVRIPGMDFRIMWKIQVRIFTKANELGMPAEAPSSECVVNPISILQFHITPDYAKKSKYVKIGFI